MFKSFQDTSALQQFHGFPNLNMQQATSAYGFSGVTFWLDAAYGLNTQTNLGAVSSWQQRVGGGTFAQATAGNQPRLILNDANYNNFPSVEAIDIARFMTAFTGLKIADKYTIVIVSKTNSFAVAAVGIIGNQLTANAGPGIVSGGSRAGLTGFGYAQNGDTNPTLQGTTESTSSRIQIATNTNIVINGSIEATGTGFAIANDLLTIFRSGGSAGGFPTNYLIGSIAEIIAFGYSMTSDEAIALSNNINQKYALY